MKQIKKGLFKEYWKEFILIAFAQFCLVFFGNVGSDKYRDFKYEQLVKEVEILNTKFEDHKKEYVTKIDILCWMHNIGIRGKKLDNNHEHKKE